MTNCIQNKACIEYQFNRGGQCMQETTCTDSVCTEVAFPHLVVQKIAQSKYFQPGEKICYSIVITNTGEAPACNIAVAEPLCKQCYVNGSATLSINGQPAHCSRLVVGNVVQEPCQRRQFGFRIGDLCPNDTAVITFCTIPDCSACAICNQVTVFYNGCNCRQSATSNTVELTKAFAKVVAEKCVNKTCATCGDELVYTIILTNCGNLPAHNVNVVDQLPACFCVKQYGVKVNGLNCNYRISPDNLLTIPCLSIPAQHNCAPNGGCGCGNNNGNGAGNRLVITITGFINVRTNHNADNNHCDCEQNCNCNCNCGCDCDQDCDFNCGCGANTVDVNCFDDGCGCDDNCQCDNCNCDF